MHKKQGQTPLKLQKIFNRSCFGLTINIMFKPSQTQNKGKLKGWISPSCTLSLLHSRFFLLLVAYIPDLRVEPKHQSKHSLSKAKALVTLKPTYPDNT